MRQKLIAKFDRFFIIKCDSLLQNATVTTKCDNFITKCDSYYKMRRLLQITTVQTVVSAVGDWGFHNAHVKSSKPLLKAHKLTFRLLWR